MNAKPAMLCASLLLTCSHAFAAVHTIHVGGSGLIFSPATTDVLVGDTVTFVNDGGFHNVASDAGAPFAFRCAAGCDGDGSGGNGGISGSTWSATITIPPAAAHQSVGFHCEAHQGQGMVGSLSVTNPVDLQSFEID